MTNVLTMPTAMWSQATDHLLHGDVEQAVVAFARATRQNDDLRFDVQELQCLRDEDFDHQSAYHISLTEECQARLILHAWTTQTSMVELHSHVDHRFAPAFSPSDLAGFREFVPHVWWRLRGQPYCALVVTPTGFDALVWRTNPEKPESLDVIQLDRETIVPSSETLRRRTEVAHVR